MTELEAIIGLEIHAQVSSKTKMFCACSNDSFGKEPNSNICPICLSFPGSLPVPNEEAIQKGVRAALALNCSIPEHSKFDRKSYFYPDLPAGYQISQYDEPVSKDGHVDILIEGEKKRIGITRLHLENDAGKLTHTGESTLLDFNRAGTPLMEIVSEPDLRSAAEAREYAQTIQKILRFVGSSDCDMEKGMMRFDASVSLRPKGEKGLRPRAEIKNLNSFRSLEAAIQYEIKRQKKLWEEGTPLEQEETVGWDDDRGSTKVLRKKESAADYRYFPEPDIPMIVMGEKELEKFHGSKMELPLEKMERLQNIYEISEAEARFYTDNTEISDFFEAVAKVANPKLANSFVGTILVKHLKEGGDSLEASGLTPAHLIELIELVEAGKISNNAAKSTLFDEMMNSKKMPSQLMEELGLTQVSDEGAIEEYCKKAIEAHPQAVADVREGKLKAMAALTGFVMKESRGQANPQKANEILKKLLGIE